MPLPCAACKPKRAFRVTLALALLAVCTPALLPFGLMLEHRNEQGIAVVLCRAQGPTLAWFDPHSLELREASERPGADAELPHPSACLFAGSALPALGASVLAFRAYAMAAQPAILQRATTASARYAAKPWATGPPPMSPV